MTKKDKNKLVNYWLTLSDYDFKTALNLKKGKKYPYALYFLHLSVEKLLKALITNNSGDQPPFSHNLVFLLGKANIEMSENILNKLKELTNFNISSRYPDERLEFYKKTTREKTEKWFIDVRKIISWLKNQLKTK